MTLSDPDLHTAAPVFDESRLVRDLRNGDQEAFVSLVDALAPAMLRLARLYVRTNAIAEEVVQETWLAVLRALDGFEGRSSLRSWIFAILANIARKRGTAEGRSIPHASATDQPDDRFFGDGHRWAGMWSTLVDSWEHVPEAKLLGEEARRQLNRELERLPIRYAVVFVLRDVEGWSSQEVCGLLGLTPENQRVLLHRARMRIRAALAEYFERIDG